MIKLHFDKNMNHETFLSIVNKERIKNKNQWISGIFTVNNKRVLYKSFNTWIQRLVIDGIVDSNNENSKVKDYKLFILNNFDQG